MADRLVQVTIPESRVEQVREIARGINVEELARHELERRAMLSYLIPSTEVEDFLDPLQTALADSDDFRIVVQSVAAALPRPDRQSLEALSASTTTSVRPRKKKNRISRAELYEELAQLAVVDKVFVLAVVLSTFVAAIGLAKGDIAVVIAAMVIAPLLGPNMALALATTLGDGPLAKRALKTSGVGIGVAFLCTVPVGLLIPLDDAALELMEKRTAIDVSAIALALLSGAAGALAFTSGVSASLVGVMVAVALLPPLVLFTVLLLQDSSEAWGAFLILVTNLICVNLAAVATFVVQGIRPRTWWEAHRSKKAAHRALAIWIVLLLVMIALINAR